MSGQRGIQCTRVGGVVTCGFVEAANIVSN
jgi:hypothetical protein